MLSSKAVADMSAAPLATRGHLWVKGQKSANPAGRPKGFKGVAKMIMEATGDGEELVDYALKIWRDKNAPADQRWQAHDWLSRRGLGNPVTTLDLTIMDEGDVRDLSALSDSQLEAIDAVFSEVHELPPGNQGATELELPRQSSGVEPDGSAK